MPVEERNNGSLSVGTKLCGAIAPCPVITLPVLKANVSTLLPRLSVSVTVEPVRTYTAPVVPLLWAAILSPTME